jgi:hypothetical protein
MQQSIFANPTALISEPDVPTPVTSWPASKLLAYGLPGAALLIALLALGVALFR